MKRKASNPQVPELFKAAKKAIESGAEVVEKSRHSSGIPARRAFQKKEIDEATDALLWSNPSV